ncbi:MAG: RluA family pseudouridine synthase [Dehalococcoidia bacterium]|nr:RluA family pseudouridine synthase [Dehalococcoidia bacterium]
MVAAAYSDLSRARVQRLIEGGQVSVNGTAVRKSGQVAAGDLVVVVVPETDHDAPTVSVDVPVLYEDGELLAIDKPAGLATHGAPGDLGPSVATWFLARYPELARAFDAERPGIVHRLDKDTSGVLVLAKTPAAQMALSAAFAERAASKTYVAITDGVPHKAKAVIEAPIARHPADRTRMMIGKGGRMSRTRYEVVGAERGHALLEVDLETGRTHQVRVHLAAIECAVRFDRVYGKGGPGRQQLHAWRLSVPHPAGGTLTVTAALPGDMVATAAELELTDAAARYAEPCAPELAAAE